MFRPFDQQTDPEPESFPEKWRRVVFPFHKGPGHKGNVRGRELIARCARLFGRCGARP